MTGVADRAEIGVALVGCGALTELFYAPALRMIEADAGVRVAALVDPVAERVAEIGARFFPQARRGGGLDDIPNNVQLAIVASPAGVHAAQTVELLGRGIHVLCEKPMAGTTAECDAMIAAARTADRILAVGHFKRFFPATRQIRALIETGAFGPVRSFRFVEGAKFAWPARSRSLFERRTGRGGVLIDAGVHALDLALWWFGDPAQTACEDDAMGGIEANCWITLEYREGVTGTLGMSRDWPMANRYLIQFERGWAAWNPTEANAIEVGWGDAYAVKGTVHEAISLLGQPAAARPAATRHQAFADQIRDVVEAVRAGRPPSVSGEDGRRVIALIETCYARSELMDMPWLDAREWTAGTRLRCSP